MSRYAMIMNAFTAASYIIIGAFDGLVTFIGRLRYFGILWNSAKLVKGYLNTSSFS